MAKGETRLDGEPGDPPASSAASANATSQTARTTGPLAYALLGLAVLAVYLPAVQAGFLWDDDTQIVENASLRSAAGLLEIWGDPGSQMQYYPLSYSLYWLEYRLWGDHPAGYHLVSILLHILNACLVVRVVERLALPGALAVATIFALHPVQVESIAWVSEQRIALSTAFILLAALAWSRHLEAPTRGRYAGALGLFGLAVLAKTMACTFPVVLLIWSWWKEPHSLRRRVPSIAPFFVLAAGLALVTVLREGTYFSGGGSAHDIGFLESCQIAGRAILFYLSKLLLPVNLMSIYPKWAVEPGRLLDWIPSVLVLGALLRLWQLRTRIGRGPLAAALFFVVTLAPVLGFIDFGFLGYSYVADRYLYLACASPALLVGIVWQRVDDGLGTKAGWAAIALLIAVLGSASRQQVAMYHDAEMFWRTNLERNPTATAHESLAGIFADAGERDRAESHLLESIGIHDTPRARIRLGLLYLEDGDPLRARTELERALELTSGEGADVSVRARALMNLGVVHYNFGGRVPGLDWRRAIPLWEEALELDPRLERGREDLARARKRLERSRSDAHPATRETESEARGR